MKKRFLAYLLACVFLLSFALSGCSTLFGSDGERSPSSVIQDSYGNEQFTITFSSEGLETPLENITYSAYNMPKLPTPERVGYIFEGWYLDSSYTIPYLDGILYLYMTDVTLYAKWSKEEFVQNGTYDIDFEAHIVEGTVVEGSATATYGGYRDFSEDIVADGTYIMKSDDGLYLQLQFDGGATPDYFSANSYPVYTVNISSDPAYSTSARLETSMTIDSYSDSVKTYYIDISDFDIGDSLYLSIQTINWDADISSIDERAKTLTTYTVEFNITRLIGFSQSFADTDSVLADGYYLAKTYYRSESNTTNMGSSFNPVYSYIIAEDGHYTLAKPFIPYAGMLGTSATGTTNDYYNRYMTFMPVQLYYSIDTSAYGDETVESDYYPEAYNGGYYGTFSLEYNADTGLCYAIYDLGTDLKSEYMVMGATTGYMEYVMGMGYSNQILSIDYEHLVKQTEIDYVPLEGDAYSYETEMQYYPGLASDLNERNLTYAAVQDLGLYTTMYNFFWSAASQNSAYSSRTMHSSRITVSPTAATAASTTAESRYEIAYFYVTAEVYGYDVQSGNNLYADIMDVTSFDGGDTSSVAMRRTKQIQVGKSYNTGDTVSLASLYAEKIDHSNTTLSGVSYTLYDLNSDGSVNWSSGRATTSAFSFESDVAVLFTWQKTTGDGSVEGTRTALVNIVEYEAPQVSVSGYDADEVYLESTDVPFPTVTYSWMGVNGSFEGLYYYGDEYNLDPTHAAIFNVEGGVYSLKYSFNCEEFTMLGDTTVLVFVMENAYGEREFYYLEYQGEAKSWYSITDEDGEEIIYDELRYNSSSAARYGVDDEYSYFVNEFTGFEAVPSFHITIGDGEPVAFEFISCTVYTYTGNKTWYSQGDIGEINDYITRNGSRYALVQIEYSCINSDGVEDELTIKYLVNATVSGAGHYEQFTQKNYFTDYEYTFARPYVMSSDGLRIGTITVYSVDKYAGDGFLSDSSSTYTLTSDDYSFSLTFHETGTYRIEYRMYFTYDGNGDRVFRGQTGKSVYLYEYVEVIDGDGEVTITYVTDEDHPFADGSTEMTVKYSLTESIFTLDYNSGYFADTSDDLWGWVPNENFTFADTTYLFYEGRVISDFIGSFNSANVTLYTVWDSGLTIKAVIDEQTGETIESATYYLSSAYNGYRVNIATDFTAPTIAGKSFVGWTGGFIGNNIVTRGTYTISDTSEENITIYAVYIDVFTVSYDTTASYVDDSGTTRLYYSGRFVTEELEEGSLVSDAESKMNLTCSREGYEFKGWYIQGDESQTLIDLSTYEITGDITFVALFGSIE